MKKLITLFVCILIINISQTPAQSILVQDFTSTIPPNLPTGWTNTVTNMSGTSPLGWQTTTSATNLYFGTVSNLPPHTEYVVVDEWGHPGNHPAILTSPTFSLATGSLPSLFFDYVFYQAYYTGYSDMERAKISISTDGGTSWTIVDSISYQSMDWSTKYVSLIGFVGFSNCQIRFTYDDVGMNLIGIAISNIRVNNPQNNDIGLVSITPDSLAINHYFGVSTSTVFSGKVTNFGSSPITSFTVSYSVDGGTQIDTNYSVSMAYLDSFSFSCPSYFVTSVGSHNIKIWVTTSGDPVLSNDTLSTVIVCVPYLPVKKLAIESGTGTWTGWSPREIVYMDSLHSIHPNDASFIEVHSSDRMSLTDYATWMQTMISGWPTVVVDRHIVDDPSNLFRIESVHSSDFGFADITISPVISGNNITVSTTINPAITLNSGDYRLVLILTEDSVHNDSSTWAQSNYYSYMSNNQPLSGGGIDYQALPNPIPATQMYYQMVARSVTPSPTGVSGMLPGTLTAGTPVFYTFSTVVAPTGIPPASWMLNRMHAVVLFIDGTTGHVLNSQNANLSDYLQYPSFVNGKTASINICSGSVDSLNNILSVLDTGTAHADTWAVLNTPTHGTLNASFLSFGVNGIDVPSGTFYKPDSGYSGLDTFSVIVSNGDNSDTVSVHISVLGNPTLSSISVPPGLWTGTTMTEGDATTGGTWSSSNSAVLAVVNFGDSAVITALSQGLATISYSIFNACLSTTVFVTNTVGVTDHATSYVITTVVGNGMPGYSGDGGTARNANLYDPEGLSVDAHDNLYIADWGENVVRKVNSAGIISTFAGTGTGGFNGDTIAATSAMLNSPNAIASDIFGNVYISDRGNGRIRKVDTTGIITTVAVCGTQNGIAVDSAKNIYFVEQPNYYCSIIQKIDSTGTVSTVAGRFVSVPEYTLWYSFGGTNPFIGEGVAATSKGLYPGSNFTIDRNGLIYICDQINSVQKVDATGNIYTIAGQPFNSGYSGDNGPATNALLNGPSAVMVDQNGNVFISDKNNFVIRDIDNSGTIHTIAGNNLQGYSGDGGWAYQAKLNSPMGMAQDSRGNIFFCDESNYVVRLLSRGISPINGPKSLCIGIPTTLTDMTNGGIWSSSDSTIISINSYNGIVTGMSAGTATITYADSSSSVTQIIIVNPLGATITGDTTICSGSTTNMVGNVASAANSFIVSTPSSIAGLKTYSIANAGGWGGAAYNFYDNQVLEAPSSDSVGCTGSYPTNFFLGKVALIWRGSCEFGYKALQAQNGGAIAVIIINNVSGGVINMGPGSYGSSVTIPVYMVSLEDGMAIEAALNSGDTVLLNNPWISSNPSVATIDPTGLVSPLAPGNTTITYTFSCACGTFRATSPLTVEPAGVSNFVLPSNVCVGTSISLTDSTPGGTWSAAYGSGSVTISGNVATGVTAGTTFLTYTVSNNCGTFYVSQSLTIDNFPFWDSISGSNFICVGDSRFLSIPGTDPLWSVSGSNLFLSAGDSITGVTAGIDTVFCSFMTGCGLLTVDKVINITPLADAGSITGLPSLCVNDTTSYFDAVLGGTWSQSSALFNLVSNHVLALGAGIDTIEYTLTTSCGTSIAKKTVIIYSPVTVSPIICDSFICVGSSALIIDSSLVGSWTMSNSRATLSGFLITGISPGTDTLLHTVINTCGTYSASKVISINPLPIVGTITGTSVICLGASTVTLSDIVSGGIWSVSNSIATVSGGIVTGVTVGFDTVKYKLTNFCGSDSTWRAITVSNLPDAGTISGTGTICPTTSTTLSSSVPGGSWSVTNLHATNLTNVITGVTAGIDSVKYSVSNSCGLSNAYFVVTINPIPSAGSIFGTPIICMGTPESLSDLATGGNWSSSNSSATVSIGGVVNGVSNGVDTISYTVSNVCGTAVATLVVTVSPMPVVGSITGSSSICPGGTGSLSDSISGGVWTVSNANLTHIDGFITGVSAGTDSVRYMVSNACGTVSANIVVTINPAPYSGVITGSSAVCNTHTDSVFDSVSGGRWTTTNGNATIDSITGIISAVSAGIDTVFYTVISLCGPSTSAHILTINPLPNAGAITGISSNVCVGTSITFTDAITGGIWSLTDSTIAGISGGILTGHNNGLVTILYSVTNICGTDVASHLVTVNPLPYASVISGSDTICKGSSETLLDSTIGGTWLVSNNNLTITSGVISGTNSGLDTVTYLVTNFCGTDSAKKIVFVRPLATANIIGTDSLCTGKIDTLTGVPMGGTWTAANLNIVVNSNGIATGVTTGTDTITYTNIGVCNTAIATIVLTVNTLPNLNVAGNSVVCIGKTDTLIGLPLGGIWNALNTDAIVSSTGIVSGVNSGIDTFTYTINSQCGIVTKSINVNVLTTHQCDSFYYVESLATESEDIYIYPNPSTGLINLVQNTPSDKIVNVYILNYLGQNVYNREVALVNGKSQLYIQNAVPGIYMMKVKNGLKTQVFRIVIE